MVDRREMRIAGLLGRVAAERQGHEDHEHRDQQGPALPRVADHPAEGVAQRRRDQQDGQQLQEIRQRRRILERVRRVRVEESTAIRAELLDRDLAGRGSERNRLFGHGRVRGRDRDRLQKRHGAIGREALHHTLADQNDGQQQRQRQQDVHRAARQVDPEVAKTRSLATLESADQRDQHCHAAGRGHEVLHAESEHLGQIAQRRLAAIALPVGVGREADGRVERRIRRHGREALRIQRQPLLGALQQVHDDEAERVERQDGDGVLLPVLLLGGIHGREPEDPALDGAKQR